MYIEILFNVIGGLGIFLLGMKNMSEGMQAIAGPTLRKMINRATTNKFMGIGMGTLVTMLVQSSSITTVMVIGLVNVNVMNLAQAFGVIMGANIGTTITAWILVLEIGKYGLPILGVATFVYLFSKRDRARYFAMAIVGLGMIFFGLELMKNGFKPLADDPTFEAWFLKFAYDGTYFSVLKCATVGAILTMIVQSSSATLGITIGLATMGVIDFPTAAALVLGENIGTTVTAFLASIGATVNARRASYSHILFNLIGVFWITLLFAPYMVIVTQIVEWVTGGLPDTMGMIENDGEEAFEGYIHITFAIAVVHTGFNTANMLLFLPFMNHIVKLLNRLLPEPEKGGVAHLKYFDVRLVDTPALGLEQSKQEILLMSVGVEKMMNHLRPFIEKDISNEPVEKKIFHREEVLDVVQKEINQFLGHLMAGNVTMDVMEEGRSQIRMADEYESISDYIVAILKLNIRLRNDELAISDIHRVELLDLHDHVMDYLLLINQAVKTGSIQVVSKARSQGEQITHLMKHYRSNHLQRIGTEHTSPIESLTISDILNAYRRIKDHALNIAEVLSGDK